VLQTTFSESRSYNSMPFLQLNVRKAQRTFLYLHILRENKCWIQQANKNSKASCSFFRKNDVKNTHPCQQFWHFLDSFILWLIKTL